MIVNNSQVLAKLWWFFGRRYSFGINWLQSVPAFVPFLGMSIFKNNGSIIECDKIEHFKKKCKLIPIKFRVNQKFIYFLQSKANKSSQEFFKNPSAYTLIFW
jgi:hypothetical protein